MKRQHLGHIELEELRQLLGERDLEIVRQVAALRLMSAPQIEAVHFPTDRYASAGTAARCRRRSLARLVRQRLLVRLERRIGGVRAGSAAGVFALGPVSRRLLDDHRPRPRLWEPSARFVDHTLAISQLVVELIAASREGDIDLAWQSEPECWRRLPGLGGRAVLRPDLFVELGIGDYIHAWFVELDRDSAHLPTLLGKCRLYESYYRSGVEQSRHGVGVFPRVLWLTPNDERDRRLREAIAHDRRLTPGLFTVATNQEALEVLTGGGR